MGVRNPDPMVGTWQGGASSIPASSAQGQVTMLLHAPRLQWGKGPPQSSPTPEGPREGHGIMRVSLSPRDPRQVSANPTQFTHPVIEMALAGERSPGISWDKISKSKAAPEKSRYL